MIDQLNQKFAQIDRDQKQLYFTILILALSLYLNACADPSTQQAESSALKLQDGKADIAHSLDESGLSSGLYVERAFGLSTPTGEKILAIARDWELGQLSEAEEYAQPRMCAHNVSEVLERSELPFYSDYLVPHMISAVKVRGGLVARLDNRDKQGFIKSLNQLFGGHLPIGSLVNGCLYSDCSGEGGDGHIAILGETDDEGVVYLYHNNWYRPDNEGGERKDHMVSAHYYDDLGLRRQWMKTPWIRVHRDQESDEIIDVEGLLPAIDDLDPYTGFFLTVSILPELLLELGVSASDELFCPIGLLPDPMLGACVDEASVYGRFSDQMTKACLERGYGEACTQTHSVETDEYTATFQRWSRRVYDGLRGHQACPAGLVIDHDLGYCIQETVSEAGLRGEAESGTESEAELTGELEGHVYGPFSKEIVTRCLEWGGGQACASGRLSLSFFRGLIGQ